MHLLCNFGFLILIQREFFCLLLKIYLDISRRVFQLIKYIVPLYKRLRWHNSRRHQLKSLATIGLIFWWSEGQSVQSWELNSRLLYLGLIHLFQTIFLI